MMTRDWWSVWAIIIKLAVFRNVQTFYGSKIKTFSYLTNLLFILKSEEKCLFIVYVYKDIDKIK